MNESKNICVGVVGAIIERDGKFLLMKEIQRHIANHPDDGKWNLPAGRLEKREYLPILKKPLFSLNLLMSERLFLNNFDKFPE